MISPRSFWCSCIKATLSLLLTYYLSLIHKQGNVAKPHNVFTELHLVQQQGLCHYDSPPLEFSRPHNHAVQKKAKQSSKTEQYEHRFGKGRKVKQKLFWTTRLKNQKSPTRDPTMPSPLLSMFSKYSSIFCEGHGMDSLQQNG